MQGLPPAVGDCTGLVPVIEPTSHDVPGCHFPSLPIVVLGRMGAGCLLCSPDSEKRA